MKKLIAIDNATFSRLQDACTDADDLHMDSEGKPRYSDLPEALRQAWEEGEILQASPVKSTRTFRIITRVTALVEETWEVKASSLEEAREAFETQAESVRHSTDRVIGEEEGREIVEIWDRADQVWSIDDEDEEDFDEPFEVIMSGDPDTDDDTPTDEETDTYTMIVTEEVMYRKQFEVPKGTRMPHVRDIARSVWLETGNPIKDCAMISEREYSIEQDALGEYRDDDAIEDLVTDEDREVEIQVFGMKKAENGDFTLAPADAVEFWDVMVRRTDGSTGEIIILEEHENLTAQEAAKVEGEMTNKYPGAMSGEWVTE